MFLFKSKNRKSRLMRNRNKFVKGIFLTEYLKRKLFYVLVYFTSVTEIHMRVICDKGVKIMFNAISVM